MSRLLAGVLAVALVVLLYWALLFVRQRAFLFPAPDPDGAPPRPADAQVVWLDTPGARIETWYLNGNNKYKRWRSSKPDEGKTNEEIVWKLDSVGVHH